jgi:hypothetical protein
MMHYYTGHSRQLIKLTYYARIWSELNNLKFRRANFDTSSKLVEEDYEIFKYNFLKNSPTNAKCILIDRFDLQISHSNGLTKSDQYYVWTRLKFLPQTHFMIDRSHYSYCPASSITHAIQTFTSFLERTMLLNSMLTKQSQKATKYLQIMSR